MGEERVQAATIALPACPSSPMWEILAGCAVLTLAPPDANDVPAKSSDESAVGWDSGHSISLAYSSTTSCNAEETVLSAAASRLQGFAITRHSTRSTGNSTPSIGRSSSNLPPGALSSNPRTFCCSVMPASAAEDLLEIIMRRYERASTILTSNRPLEDWPQLFGDTRAVAAFLDRLMHHSRLAEIRGKSYRLHAHSLTARDRKAKASA